MPSERIGSLFKRTNRTNAENDQEAYLELNAWFQRGEVWKDDMRVRLIETILLGYALNPIWVIIKKDKDEELVLDGKQRLTTICDFMNNEFVLTDIIPILFPREYAFVQVAGAIFVASAYVVKLCRAVK